MITKRRYCTATDMTFTISLIKAALFSLFATQLVTPFAILSTREDALAASATNGSLTLPINIDNPPNIRFALDAESGSITANIPYVWWTWISIVGHIWQATAPTRVSSGQIYSNPQTFPFTRLEIEVLPYQGRVLTEQMLAWAMLKAARFLVIKPGDAEAPGEKPLVSIPRRLFIVVNENAQGRFGTRLVPSTVSPNSVEGSNLTLSDATMNFHYTGQQLSGYGVLMLFDSLVSQTWRHPSNLPFYPIYPEGFQFDALQNPAIEGYNYKATVRLGSKGSDTDLVTFFDIDLGLRQLAWDVIREARWQSGFARFDKDGAERYLEVAWCKNGGDDVPCQGMDPTPPDGHVREVVRSEELSQRLVGDVKTWSNVQMPVDVA